MSLAGLPHKEYLSQVMLKAKIKPFFRNSLTHLLQHYELTDYRSTALGKINSDDIQNHSADECLLLSLVIVYA